MDIMDKWKNEYLVEDKKYENHVNKFIEYLKSINKGNRPTSIMIDDVVDCIGSYNKKQKINTISSMENHLEAVKAFYKYLVSKNYTTDIFSAIHSYSDFKKNIIQLYNLNEMQEREFLDLEIIKEILVNLERYFTSNVYENLSGVNQRKRYNKNLVLNLFIKLTLIYPTKRNIICNLTVNDFIDDFRVLRINKLNILVPNNLRQDIKKIIKFVENMNNRKVGKKERIFNFIYGSGFRGENINSWFCDFLKENDIIDIPSTKDTYSSEAIMNTIIRCMIENNTNPAIISKVSNLSLSTLESKFYSNKYISIENEDEIINTELNRIGLINYI